MKKDLDENSNEKQIENIEKGKSYLKSNEFFRSKPNLFKPVIFAKIPCLNGNLASG